MLNKKHISKKSFMWYKPSLLKLFVIDMSQDEINQAFENRCTAEHQTPDKNLDQIISNENNTKHELLL